jgi:hypothetical protein
MVKDNPFCGGQPADLDFGVESVKFLGPPCLTGEQEGPEEGRGRHQGRLFKSRGAWGRLAIQAEGSDSTDGPDQLVIESTVRVTGPSTARRAMAPTAWEAPPQRGNPAATARGMA